MDEVRFDLDSYEVVSKALWDLVNVYPDLGNDAITFADIDSENGTTLIPTSGAVILEETTDVTGHTTQICVYPFTIMTKAAGLSQRKKVNTKEWLDNIGRWLEKQPIKVNNDEFQLTSYPTLTGDREFKKIERTQPSYLSEVSQNNVETWVISLQATYKNEFDR